MHTHSLVLLLCVTFPWDPNKNRLCVVLTMVSQGPGDDVIMQHMISFELLLEL